MMDSIPRGRQGVSGGARIRTAGVGLLVLTAGVVRANYLIDVTPNPVAPFSNFQTIFPNWLRLPTSAFNLESGDNLVIPGCAAAGITGLTIFNYGTAVAGTDIKAVYAWFQCGGKNDSGMLTLTYAGAWVVGPDTFPAWTWGGTFTYATDPCLAPGANGGCSCFTSLYLYTDIGSCPTDGAVVELGPGFNDITPAPGGPGGIADACGLNAPWGAVTDSVPKEIRYVTKEGDRDSAAPGDTITYTIYYGRPGTSAISSVTIMDSQPPYTHLVQNSAVPAPDPLWDPDPGPPVRLRWTLPGGATTGGATSSVIFSLTVDWGNHESFEPGSGNTAAPEGIQLANRAQAFWAGASCTPSVVTQPTDTVVSRFLFWKIGNNDILFASGYAVPDDEMIYEVFLKNLSTQKTWWNVDVWDTVPAELDVWGPNYGLDDPCQGWTMSPSGCAAASAGRILSAGKTILTWNLDMAPGMTLSLRYKARLKPTVSAGTTAINRVTLLEQGQPGIFGGTGSSVKPASFTHLAVIVLRTTYFSYTSYAASLADKSCPGFFITMFPLNVGTNFELRKLEYVAAGVALTGGKSASINTLAGSCVGGFAADGGLSVAGCKIERAPAMYWPGIWDNICPTFPFNFFYKVSSNSPILWLTMAEGSDGNDDSFTYLPSTSLSYVGFTHYTTMRPDESALAALGHGDRLVIFNTSLDSNSVYDPNLATTVHLFRWNAAALTWDYVKTGHIGGESLWMPLEGTSAPTVDDAYHFRIISSDAQNMIYQGYHTFGAPGIGGAFDNHGGMVPNRNNGNLVSPVGAGVFYTVSHPSGSPNCIVGNTSLASPATYKVYKYAPLSTKVPNGNWPTTMAGSSGTWIQKTTDTVNAGLVPGLAPAQNGNSHVYGNGYDTTMNSNTYATAWKIELTGGGPIQVNTGCRIFSQWSGASNLHAADGGQAGSEFWFHHADEDGDGTLYVNVFCPKTGMAMQINSAQQPGGGGYSARYTTDGVDQVIVFLPFTDLGAPNRTNFRITMAAAGAQGDTVAQYLQAKYTEKFFTAPFVRTGVHYDVIAPPTVFTGQSFWITIVVIDSGGGTKVDYCGTTNFTSTDATAQMLGGPMDAYSYTWTSNNPPGCGSLPFANGVKVFVNVIFTKLGLQTLVASDMADGSILGLATIMVVGADVKLTKEPKLSIQASGDTVTFKICWSNYSSASAFTFVITDAVPMGTTFVPEVSSGVFSCGGTDGLVPIVAYSNNTTTTPPAGGSFITNNPPTNAARWLRWTVPMAGVQTTGCVCFRVSVN